MPKIATILSHDDHGQQYISLLLSRDALFLDPEGIPSPGIGLSAAQARLLADRLVMLAGQADGQVVPESAKGSPAAILVVHDGTLRGDRAFGLALTMAQDSDATLYLYVCDQFQLPSPADDIVEECARQLGALQVVAARCAAEAASRAIRLKACVISMDAQGGAIVPPQEDIDFLILPQPDASSEEAVCRGDVGRYVVLVR